VGNLPNEEDNEEEEGGGGDDIIPFGAKPGAEPKDDPFGGNPAGAMGRPEYEP